MTDAEGLFVAHRDRVFRYFCRAVGADCAGDLTQEVFLRATRSPAPAIGDGRGWIFRVARNLALDYQRHRRRHPEAAHARCCGHRCAIAHARRGKQRHVATAPARRTAMTRAILAVVILLIHSIEPVSAQASANTADLAIFVRGYITATNGAETASGVTYDALAIPGQTATGTMGARGCGYFAASSRDGALDKADVGWRLAITPTRVEEGTVTLRLRWSRVIDKLSDSATPLPSGDMELTLKLGESRPLDSIRVPRDATTFDGKPCDKSQATLRVGIEPYPIEQYDRRLIATDIWLVERLTGGKERTELVSLRSLPSRSASFYFDSIRDREMSLDIYGHLLANLDGNAVELAIETVSRWDAKPPAYPYRWLQSTVRVRPEEVVDVPLPKLGKEAGSFGDRSFSLRVRARRIR